MVDAGSIALSKDTSTAKLGPQGDCGYGLVVDAESGELLGGLYVHTAYQEHGLIRSRDGAIDHDRFPIGRRLRVLPNHACLTPAAYDRYQVVADDSGAVAEVWPRINGW